MSGTVEVSEDVRTFVEEGAVCEKYPVSEAVAARLVERFGSAVAVGEATRDELQQVTGVGPATAAEINPPTSALLDEKMQNGGLTPAYLDENGVHRAPEEKDEHPPMRADENEGESA
jgi:hypothetical protein